MTDPASKAPIVASGYAHCECGRRLNEEPDERVPFRRATDHVMCDGCLYSYSIASIRAAIVAAVTEDVADGLENGAS